MWVTMNENNAAALVQMDCDSAVQLASAAGDGKADLLQLKHVSCCAATQSTQKLMRQLSPALSIALHEMHAC